MISEEMEETLATRMTKGAKGGGTIRQRPDGRWEARYTLGIDPGTGKQIQKSVYGKTQKEVRQKLTAITADLRGHWGQLSESEQAATAESIAGKNAMSGFLALMNAAPGDISKLEGAIDSCSDSMDGYNGTAEKMAAVMQDNLAGQLTILKSQLEELAISIGEIMMPVIRDVVTHIQGVVDKLNALPEPVKQTIVTIALIAAAVGPVLIVIGKVISSVGSIVSITGKFVSFMSATAIPAISAVAPAILPILPIIAAVVAAIAAVILIVKNWGKISSISVIPSSLSSTTCRTER